MFFSFSSPAKRTNNTKRTNNANNATHYVRIGKETRESSKRNYHIISPGPRVMIAAIIIVTARRFNNKKTEFRITVTTECYGTRHDKSFGLQG